MSSNWISNGISFLLNWNGYLMKFLMKFSLVYHWNLKLIFNGILFVFLWNINRYSLKLQLDFICYFYWISNFHFQLNWQFLFPISNRFPLIFHWNCNLISNLSIFKLDFNWIFNEFPLAFHWKLNLISNIFELYLKFDLVFHLNFNWIK